MKSFPIPCPRCGRLVEMNSITGYTWVCPEQGCGGKITNETAEERAERERRRVLKSLAAHGG